ncbi:putative transcriptional regulator protein [Pusillimonas sp. T7-7]|uniref:TetR/AcrR family transcriptional regulator n=1 Tax=Pusillimonas sp. (strain T7-7) TaxID=1007105 RepID=UPI00020855BD|nr:TetR/AcrR family transcriptional regulator [Pusillimonas sp. T7-7]AEC21965.1 putative transcriptional regulator protein [Pusillimonas sp. T7-7]
MKQSVFISPTAARVLDAAQILIQNNGYNGFSYEDLSRMVGLRKPSLHHHFPKKEDLGATVVERYTERFVLALSEIENTHADAAEQIQAYVSLFIDTYGATQRLCPCGMLGAEAETLPNRVRVGVTTFFELNLSWLEAAVARGKKSGAFTLRGSPEQAALLLFAALEGAMVVGRGLNRSAAVAAVGQAAMHSVLTVKST